MKLSKGRSTKSRSESGSVSLTLASYNKKTSANR